MLAPSTLLVTTLMAIGAWGAEAVGAWWVIQAAPGCAATLEEATFIFSFSTLAGAVSMLPGGLAATEGSMVALLQGGFALAPTPEAAAAVTLVIRACTLWFAVLLGAMALLWWNRGRGTAGVGPGSEDGPGADEAP